VRSELSVKIHRCISFGAHPAVHPPLVTTPSVGVLKRLP
jgi:hypothetical protein